MSDLSRSPESSDSGTDELVRRGEVLRATTDARLVLAIRSGHADALAEVYDRHGPFVYGLALRLCGQQHAEELTGQVFLALWRSPADFVPPAGSLRATLVAETHRRATVCLQSQHSPPGGGTPIPGGAR